MLEQIKLKKSFIYLLLGIILLAHAFILTKLIYFPYPELFIYPYLTNHGLKPYSQILDQHFPGLMFLPINFDNLGMNTPETAMLWSVSVVLIIHIMLFFIAGEILKSRKKAILVNVLYLIWQPFFEGWVLWIDSFLPLLMLPAFYSLYRSKFFEAGILIGLAVVFKQTVIPFSLFVLIYIFWKTRNLKTCLRFLLGIFIPVSSIIIYLISIGVLRDFWYWTVIFNLTAFAKEGRGTGPTAAHLSRVILVFGTPFLIIRKIKLAESQILIIFLVGTLLGLSTRFDFVHFQPVLPFAVLATLYGFVEIRSQTRFGKLPVVGYAVILVWWLIIFYKGHLGDRVISFDANTRELAVKIRDYTNPGEEIFVFGGEPQLYQMSNTLPAGGVFVFQFPWFLKVAEGRILQGIIKDKPKIIVSDKTVEIEGQKITEFAKDIDQFINQNYHKIDNVGITDILQRNSTI